MIRGYTGALATSIPPVPGTVFETPLEKLTEYLRVFDLSNHLPHGEETS
jgi:hypothetical protein